MSAPARADVPETDGHGLAHRDDGNGRYSLRDPGDRLSSGSWSSPDIGQPVRLLGEIDNFPGRFRLFHGGL